MPVLLTALLLTHRTISGFTLTDTFQLLTERLSPAAQVRHGVRDDCPGPDTVTYRQVEYLFRRFSLCTDPAGATDDADRSRRLQFWLRMRYALVQLRADGQLTTSDANRTATVSSACVGYRTDPDAVWRYRRPVVRGPHHVGHPLPDRSRVRRSDSTPRATSEEANAPEQDAQSSGDMAVDLGYSAPGSWTSRRWRAAYAQHAPRGRMFGQLKGDD
jgi:hypothetical protein